LKICLVSDTHWNYAYWTNHATRTLLGLTDYERIEFAVETINTENPDLVLVNGDIFEGTFTQTVWGNVKNILDGFNAPYYVSKGNHDCINYSDWKNIFNMEVTYGEDDIYHFEYMGYAFICLDVYQTPNGGNWGEVVIDESELGTILDSYSESEGIFVFSHWISTVSTRNLIANTPNAKMIFFGHSHLKAFEIEGYGVPIYTDQHFAGPYDGTQRTYDKNKPWAYRVVDINSEGVISTHMVEVIHYPSRFLPDRVVVSRENK